ncbi:ribose-5-phosphate isomerase RpiA [Halobaculum litoreum]|uniref:Ribose-5-phosphate isomerase A n=1 Tax=Halobaculum litoreum TaxID=3031998 RepID=A0ABD5XR17_9EURY|nr:ribose-5-phosphate isomerase RpiA [Halobaculum sp. DT92]
MKNTAGSEAAKRAAGEAAAAAVSDGDRVGLGTGSTAAHAVRRLGERVADGLDVEAVATSYQSRALAREVGVPLLDLADVARVDVAVDGADQVAAGANALVKGGGAAHAREKVVAATADRFLVVADDSKLADGLDYPVPVEVLPDALARVERAVVDAGGDPTLRAAERKDGPVVTDNGNLVLDCDFGTVAEPGALARTLSDTAGVVEHGLFVGLADAVYVGDADGDVSVREP